jgi:cell division protein FtsI (penicillin-binding protein 3)
MRRFIQLPLAFFTHHLNSWQKQMHDRSILEKARNRTLIATGLFFLTFLVIGMRLFDVMVLHSHGRGDFSHLDSLSKINMKRADILDRNGEILATHLITGSVYANPKVIINAEDAALKLSKLFPDLGYENLLRKLSSEKGFIWIVRHIPPKMQQEVNHLGIPGVYIQQDERRVYPHGPLVSHVLGYCGIDNDGLGGVEQYFDARLKKDPSPLWVSIDIRAQHIVRKILLDALEEFRAIGANAMIVDAVTGEVLAMVSLPDFDPNLPSQNSLEATFNRNTLGTYECGSVFKIFNTAIALESGKAKLTSLYDASVPLKVGNRRITDFKAKNRILDVREVFVYSSNIGSAKMALDFGSEVQRQYLGRFGLMTAPKLELHEIGYPTVPKQWTDATTVTVSYGYGISVSHFMLLDALRRVIMGRTKYASTLLKRTESISLENDKSLRVVSESTSMSLRELMRAVVTSGAGLANVPGYEVFGKTGTAYKNNGRRGYNQNERNCTWVGGFPQEDPKYFILVSLDSPKPTKSTHGYATAGWNAAAVAGRIISSFASLMGVHRVQKTDINKGMNPDVGLINLKHVVKTDDKIDDMDDSVDVEMIVDDDD